MPTPCASTAPTIANGNGNGNANGNVCVRQPMDRRRFLLSSAAAAAVAAWPRLLRRAFGDTSFGARPGAVGQLAAASERARSLGKPLLVMVVPADDAAKWTRGGWFGEWLNHGSDEQMAPLALAEVACATMAELRAVAPVGDGEPLMVLLDDDQAPARLDAALPSSDGGIGWDPTEEQRIDQRIAKLAALARAAIAPDDKTVARRAATARARLGAEADAVERAFRAGAAPPAQVDRAAAAIAALAVDEPLRGSRQRLLAEAARLRVRDRPPVGGHWARTSACGPIRVEDLPDPELAGVIVGCGMGHVPARSSRFLYFWSQSPSERARAPRPPKDG